MVTKFLKFTGLFFLLTTLMGCPSGDENCFDYGASARVDNLITLTPMQETYNQGDILTLKASIPALNTYFGNEINLFNKTTDDVALLSLGFNQLFLDNELMFEIGSQNSNHINWLYAPYNPNLEVYEIELKIKLNKVGAYSFYTDDSFEFQGNSECNRYRLDTNIAGLNSEGKIEFSVQ